MRTLTNFIFHSLADEKIQQNLRGRYERNLITKHHMSIETVQICSNRFLLESEI